MNYVIEITIAITLPIGAIIGYFARQFIEDKIIRKRDRDNRYALAYDAFAREFTPALQRLADPNDRADIIVRDDLPRHEAAFFAFAHMVSGMENESVVNQKWTHYRNKAQKIKKYTWGELPASEHADLLESDGHTAKDFNQILKTHIEELLKVAKH